MPRSILTAGASGTEELRLTQTIESWIPRSLVSHGANHDPFYRWMLENRRVKRGGVGMTIEVVYKYFAAGNARMTGVNDPFVSRSRVQPRGRARGTWKCAELCQTYSIPDRDIVEQGSQTRILNAVDAAIDDANEQWWADLTAMLWAAETVAKSGGDDDTVASVRTLVNKSTAQGTNTFYGPLPRPAQSSQDDGNGWVSGTHGANPAGGSSAVVVVGGINRAAADTGVQFCAPVWNPPSTGMTFGRLAFNQMISAGGLRGETVDMMFLDPDLYDGLMGILQSQVQLPESRLASYGFDAFRWRGVEFVAEDNMPASPISGSGQALGLVTKNLAIVAALEKPSVTSAKATDAPTTDYRVSDYIQLVPRKLGRGLGVRHTAIIKPTS